MNKIDPSRTRKFGSVKNNFHPRHGFGDDFLHLKTLQKVDGDEEVQLMEDIVLVLQVQLHSLQVAGYDGDIALTHSTSNIGPRQRHSW